MDFEELSAYNTYTPFAYKLKGKGRVYRASPSCYSPLFQAVKENEIELEEAYIPFTLRKQTFNWLLNKSAFKDAFLDVVFSKETIKKDMPVIQGVVKINIDEPSLKVLVAMQIMRDATYRLLSIRNEKELMLKGVIKTVREGITFYNSGWHYFFGMYSAPEGVIDLVKYGWKPHYNYGDPMRIAEQEEDCMGIYEYIGKNSYRAISNYSKEEIMQMYDEYERETR